jgi:hypothetical protein
MLFDLHLHTSRYSPDSVIDPFELVDRAREVGLDGIVITEHDRLWPEHELEELRARGKGLVVLAGVEIAGRGGDMLCYGVSSLAQLRRGTPWPELTAEVHRQGGVCVAAHPYRWGQPFDELEAAPGVAIDGVEMMSNNMDPYMRDRAAEFLRKHPDRATLGNSDAHEVEVIGYCRTRFAVPVHTMDDLVAAIRDRQATPIPPA